MRSSLNGRTARIAAMAASLALLAAACGDDPKPTPTGPNGDGVPGGGASGLELTTGVLLISDGTQRVQIGDAIVTFPGPVTDAVWSPDGSRIAYVDGAGNIATALPDGTDVLVLTATDPSVVRSRPTWSREWIIYAEKKADGSSALKSVPTNGCSSGDTPATGGEWPMDTGAGTSYIDLAPSASTTAQPVRLAFQHDEPGGPEIWINDSNQRVPLTYKAVNGSEPAITLDGQKLAYVGRDGDIYVTTPREAAPAGTRITVGVQHPTRLAWSPDGQYIAYTTADSVQQVGASGGASAPTTLAPTAGVSSYLPGSATTLVLVTAGDPTALSIAASQARWVAEGMSSPAQAYYSAHDAAVGVADDPPPPATHGPVLLLGSTDQLDPRVAAELRRIFGTVQPDLHVSARPWVHLGPGVSSAVEEAITAMGFVVSRQPPERSILSESLCAPIYGRMLIRQRLVVVDGRDRGAASVAWSFAPDLPVLELDGALTDEQITWLRHSSASIESVYVIGSVPPDVQQQIVELVSGPLGFTTTSNPVASLDVY